MHSIEADEDDPGSVKHKPGGNMIKMLFDSYAYQLILKEFFKEVKRHNSLVYLFVF